MRIRDIFTKLDSFGLFMEQWGVLQESDDRVEADKWHQSAASIRDELISDIKGVAGKSDKARSIYLKYQNGQLTADQAIKQIGTLYQ